MWYFWNVCTLRGCGCSTFYCKLLQKNTQFICLILFKGWFYFLFCNVYEVLITFFIVLILFAFPSEIIFYETLIIKIKLHALNILHNVDTFKKNCLSVFCCFWFNAVMVHKYECNWLVFQVHSYSNYGASIKMHLFLD